MNAAGYLDTSKTATLTIDFRPEEISASDVKFELFKVADVDEYAEFTLTSSFSGLPVDMTVSDSSVWSDIVTEAESCIASNSIKANYSAVTNEDGMAVFSDIPVGLYLLRGKSFIANHDVYKPQSYLIMLPNRSGGSWEYNVTSVPKFTKSDELIDLKVTKKWVGGKASTRPEEITVILYCDDTEYETIALNTEGGWTYTWPQLNAKNSWTVSEVTVEGYKTTLEANGSSFVITNTAPPSDGLPQTGLISWPIPLLSAIGIIFCLAGVLMIKKHSKSA